MPRGLIDKEYAKQLSARIDPKRAIHVAEHGTPANWRQDLFERHTTHIAAADAGLPLETVQLNQREIGALYQRQLVLVRPDGHVAWRADAEPADARALIDVVRGETRKQKSVVSNQSSGTGSGATVRSDY